MNQILLTVNYFSVFASIFTLLWLPQFRLKNDIAVMQWKCIEVWVTSLKNQIIVKRMQGYNLFHKMRLRTYSIKLK